MGRRQTPPIRAAQSIQPEIIMSLDLLQPFQVRDDGISYGGRTGRFTPK
jgi:hypothetical protein